MIIYIYDANAICCKMIQNAKYDTWARNMLFEDSRKEVWSPTNLWTLQTIPDQEGRAFKPDLAGKIWM